jgi:hypothetical protein
MLAETKASVIRNTVKAASPVKARPHQDRDEMNSRKEGSERRDRFLRGIGKFVGTKIRSKLASGFGQPWQISVAEQWNSAMS